MNHAGSPELSVIIVTPDNYDTIRKVVACLRSQSAHDQMELVLVTPSACRLELNESELSKFARFRVLEVGEIKSIGAANAAGVRYSSAPVVALAEDHAFPDPAWAEALIDAHQENWAAVGPVVRNANPGSAISCADFLIAYGVWQEGVSGGIVEHLPGHNSSYKRSVLLEYGADLETMLEAESVLHWDLNRRGYRLCLEPRAKISHLNFGVLSSWLAAQFHSGRMFASIRSRDWSAVRRSFYTCASPLIPGVRFWRLLRQSYQHSRKLPLLVYPALVLGLTVSGLGEMTGYALGMGQARRRLTHLEFHRIRHIGRRSKLVKIGE
jgi:GT2 family glycosyltransferase